MNALTFLTPESASEKVLARTPMERRARAAGAKFERRGAWNVAVAYPDQARERESLTERVAFADRSQLVKLELQAEQSTLAYVVSEASGGLVLTPGCGSRANGTWWCPVTPDRVLVLGEPSIADRLRASVSEAAEKASAPLMAADVTCGLAALALIGPDAHELLARFCALDVRPAVMPRTGFRPGSVARTPGYALREGEQRLLVLVGWALGEYLWQVVADAAAHLGGGPVGAAALEAAGA